MGQDFLYIQYMLFRGLFNRLKNNVQNDKKKKKKKTLPKGFNIFLRIPDRQIQQGYFSKGKKRKTLVDIFYLKFILLNHRIFKNMT